jgi:hypothetical protein
MCTGTAQASVLNLIMVLPARWLSFFSVPDVYRECDEHGSRCKSFHSMGGICIIIWEKGRSSFSLKDALLLAL